MNVSGPSVQKHIAWPTHAVPRKYMEPILYLAERMTQQDKIMPPPAHRVVDELAEKLRMKDFRRQPWFRGMNDQTACRLIDMETVKRGTLVLLTLVMKVDTTRGENAKAYFTRIREMLDADAIAVPADLEQHRELVTRYMVG